MSELSDPRWQVTPAELRARRSVKWGAHSDDVLPLWIAEMDFPVADVIRDDLAAAVQASALGYPLSEADGLREAFATYAAEHYGQELRPEWMLVTADVLRAVEIALTLRTPRGAGVMVPTPSYPQLLTLPRYLGYPVIEVPIRDDATLDLDAIDAAFDAGGHTVILIQPHNPLGRVWSAPELTELAALVTRRGGRVISDEVHSPLSYVPHVPYSAVPGAAAHAFTATSAAKGWTIPGLKCAQLVAHNAEDAALFATLPMFAWNGASILGIRASETAYREGEPWRRDAVAFLAEQGRWLESELAARLPELGWTRPDATYFAWLDLRRFGLGADAADVLLRHGLAVNSGVDFGEVGAGWVRLNYATGRDILADAVDRLAQALTSGA